MTLRYVRPFGARLLIGLSYDIVEIIHHLASILQFLNNYYLLRTCRGNNLCDRANASKAIKQFLYTGHVAVNTELW